MTTSGPLVIGPLPPPIGGAAHVTQRVVESLRDAGAHPRLIDTSVETLAHQRGLEYHRTRVARALRVLGLLLRPGRRFDHGYLVPDGGGGVWYSLAYACASFARTRRLVIHHHSCRYIDEKDPAIALLTRITRSRGEHIFLTPGMDEAFQALYGAVRSRVINNAVYTTPQGRAARENTAWHFGHLSNLCRDKGFFLVVDTFESVLRDRPSAHLSIAGPVLEEGVQKRLEDVLRRHPENVTYYGAVFGQDKLDFYEGLDLFLFPTQFAQEAAPNVVYEAASFGVPTLAVARGRLGEITAGLGGAAVDATSRFGDLVLQWLASHDPDDLAGLKAQVKTAFDSQHAEAERALAALAALLSH